MTAELTRGDSVINTKCPHWGLGVILDIRDSTAEVDFQNVGRKRIRLDFLAPSGQDRSFDTSSGSSSREYERQLNMRLAAFLSIANKPGIEKIEEKIREAFLRSGRGKAEVKMQLRRWVDTRRFGRHDKAYADAIALYNFLFPDQAVPPGGG